MTSVLLIYPYFRRAPDRSRFRFPPLGVAYLAGALRREGHAVRVLDCTFLRREEALRRALAIPAEVVGISCLATTSDDCLGFARELRDRCDLLVAGGPLPTCEPAAFLEQFDVVVAGEGEQTMVDLLAAHAAGGDLAAVPGVIGRDAARVRAASRPFISDLDGIAFPARDLLPNEQYIGFGRRRYGFAVTTVMSTRGCPFACEFCSNVVFGRSYRERSPGNVLDEVEQALGLGYDHISFADDVFTLNRERVTAICRQIGERGLRFTWECLGRVDAFDEEMGHEMKKAGCRRVFFGIESGSNETLTLMNKKASVEQARLAVHAARRAGLQVGAFFIVCYPGETDDTVLDTLRLARELPLDYVGLTMPYPLPGTALCDRVGTQVTRRWRPADSRLLDQVLTFAGDFSATKMRFAIVKGRAEFEMKRRLGQHAPLALKLSARPTDALFRLLR